MKTQNEEGGNRGLKKRNEEKQYRRGNWGMMLRNKGEGEKRFIGRRFS